MDSYLILCEKNLQKKYLQKKLKKIIFYSSQKTSLFWLKNFFILIKKDINNY